MRSINATTTMAAAAVLALGAAGCADEPSPGVESGQVALQPDTAPPASPTQEAVPDEALHTVTGEASYYSDQLEGRPTASGAAFRQNQMVAAHRKFPFGTVLRVTNLRNDRSVQVQVVDRGPFGARAEERNTILDLSRRAAQQLGYTDAGRTPVRIEVLEWGEGAGSRAG